MMYSVVTGLLNLTTLVLYLSSLTALVAFEDLWWAVGILITAQIVEFFHRYIAEQ